MKKKIVVILTTEVEDDGFLSGREEYVRNFCNRVEAYLGEDTKVNYTTFSDLEYVVSGGETIIRDGVRGYDLRDVTFVYFKNWMSRCGIAKTLAQYLKKHNVKFGNNEVSESFIAGKVSQMFTFAEQGILVPDTFFCSGKRMKDIFDNDILPDFLSYPVIMKANDAARGNDNYLITNSAAGYDLFCKNEDPTKDFLLQQYVQNDGDFRLLFFGLSQQPLVFHRKAIQGSHINNTSNGGNGTLVDIEKVPTARIEIARKAARVTGREIGGVDIIVDKHSHKEYVLEVNGSPALATGYQTDLKAVRFAQFVDSI